MIPVHISSAANGSIRCGNPPDIGVFHLPSSNWEPGLFSLCEHAEHTRQAEMATTVAGAIISTIGMGLARNSPVEGRGVGRVGRVRGRPRAFCLVIGDAVLT